MKYRYGSYLYTYNGETLVLTQNQNNIIEIKTIDPFWLAKDILSIGDSFYGTTNNKFYQYVEDRDDADAIKEFPNVNDILFRFGAYLFFYNGNSIQRTGNEIILKEFATSFTGDGFNKGDIAFNSDTRLLRIWNGIRFNTYPFIEGVSYRYKGKVYKYNGTTLVPTINVDLSSLSNSCQTSGGFGGIVLKNKKILLSGASLASHYNGWFEFTMKKLGLEGKNLSEPSANAMWLANELYNNGSKYNDYDVLLLSHVHDYDINDLPEIFINYTPEEYERNGIIPYNGDTFGYLPSNKSYDIDGTSYNFTINNLYAIAFDYIVKKWSKLCFDLNSVPGYDSVFGKPVQIMAETYWNTSRTIYNQSIRNFCKKWNIHLIKVDEQIGFPSTINTNTGQTWSMMFLSTGWDSTETINGLIYAVHPMRVADTEFWEQWQQGDMKLSYLPYIQKKHAAITIDVFKNVIYEE